MRKPQPVQRLRHLIDQRVATDAKGVAASVRSYHTQSTAMLLRLAPPAQNAARSRLLVPQPGDERSASDLILHKLGDRWGDDGVRREGIASAPPALLVIAARYAVEFRVEVYLAPFAQEDNVESEPLYGKGQTTPELDSSWRGSSEFARRQALTEMLDLIGGA